MFNELMEEIKGSVSEVNYNIFYLTEYKGLTLVKASEILGIKYTAIKQKAFLLKQYINKNRYIREKRYNLMCLYLQEAERKYKKDKKNTQLLSEIERLKYTIQLYKEKAEKERKKEQEKLLKEQQKRNREEKKRKLERDLLINNSALWLLDKLQ